MRKAKISLRQLAPFSLIARNFRREYANAVTRWVEHSGFDWAKSRADSLVLYVRDLAAGNPCTRPKWIHNQWLCYPEMVVSRRSDKAIIELIAVLRSYTLLGESKTGPSKADEVKFISAVTDPWTGRIPRFKGFSRAVKSLAKHVDTEIVPIRTFWALKGKEFAAANELFIMLNRMRYNDRKFGVNLVNLANPSLMLASKEELIAGGGHLHALEGQTVSERDVLGKIKYRVQTDGKVRYYYAAPRYMQWLLRPFARRLYKGLKNLPQDCTYDQEKGVDIVAGWIKKRKHVQSIDLTSATDRLPWQLVRKILLHLAPNADPEWIAYIEFMDRLLCLSIPIASQHSDRTHAVWAVGQPLGTIPSFALLAYTQHLLVRWAAARTKYAGNLSDLPYVILGDDVVIRDKRIAKSYREILSALGVPVNDSKSVDSRRLGEFAGRTILRNAYGFKLKHLHAKTLRTLRSTLNTYGRKAIRMYPKSLHRDALYSIEVGPLPGATDEYNDFLFQIAVEYYALLAEKEDEVRPLPLSEVKTIPEYEANAIMLQGYTHDMTSPDVNYKHSCLKEHGLFKTPSHWFSDMSSGDFYQEVDRFRPYATRAEMRMLKAAIVLAKKSR
jgi:hypothetical protein